MSIDQAMPLATRLLTQAQALAALVARVRLLDLDEEAEPALLTELDRVVDVLDARQTVESLAASDRAILVGFVRSYLRQALELLEEPTRPGAWTHGDPAVLQAQGAASAVVAKIIAGAGLGSPDARILDVGTGVGRLAIAFCERYPDATVVGVDPWEPALRLARANIAEAGLASRITLLNTPVQRFTEPDAFDLVWFPSFFVPEPVLDTALTNVRRCLRPDGTLVLGVFEASADELNGAVDRLMTVRSGGTPLTLAEAIARVEHAGFGDVREVPRTWQSPLQLVVGQPPAAGRMPRIASEEARSSVAAR